ncbi:MAG: patatin-like phospholipase family protein [Clostridia bacterium]|nr:patatin-like phospholipase family protein [Clostridia bacterium]
MFGLVLEGGGTKGAYHLGAYKAINELGLEINTIVGASIGAINGALFAQGDFYLAEKIWNDISVTDVINLPEKITDCENVLDIKNVQVFYKEMLHKKGLDITPFEKLLRSVIDEDKIRSSNISFGLATFNVTGIKEQQMFMPDIPRGMLVDYLLASACLPIFQPKKINNSVFIDGGVTNNLPVDMLIKKGCRDIICVEVGGIGLSKRVSGAGHNIITVKCGKGSVKTLDFNHKSIFEATKLGYLDTLLAFGRVWGTKFYFTFDCYRDAKLKYGDKLLYGLELAAEYFDIDRLKIYTVDEMICEVIQKFSSVQ